MQELSTYRPHEDCLIRRRPDLQSHEQDNVRIGTPGGDPNVNAWPVMADPNKADRMQIRRVLRSRV